MFPHDGGTIPFFFVRKGAIFERQRLFVYKAGFNVEIEEIPWCFQTGVEVHSNVS